MHILQEKVDVSVVVCHHVGRELLDKCLDSVRKSDQIKYEIILVSSIPKIDAGEDVLVIHSTEGPAYKRNLASRFARGKYLVFLDDDVEISPYCLYHLWEFMESHPKCGMGFSKILKMDRRDIFDDCGSWITPTGFLYSRAGNNQEDRGQFDEPQRCASSKSAICITPANAFRTCGVFDSAYYILGEETDLAWRLWLRGWEAWYNPHAVGWHAFGTRFKPIDKHYTLSRIHFHGCKNYINLLLTNLGACRLLWILPFHLLGWFVSAVGFLFTGRPMRSYQILKGMWWNVIHLRQTLRKRHRVQSTRKISDRRLLEIIGYSPPISYYLGRMSRYLIQGLHG